MKHRTYTEGMIFRIVLAAALGVGFMTLPGQAASASTAASGRIDVLSPQCNADVSITVSDTPDPVLAGGPLTYTLTVTNHGPETTTSISVSDTLPDGTTFRSLAAPTGWTCTTPVEGAAGTVTCSRGSMSVGAREFTLTVDVAPGLPSGTVLGNTAVVSWQYDTNPANNTSTTTTTVERVPADTITTVTSHDPDPSVAGEPVTVEFSVAPAPPVVGAPSGGVTVTDGVDSCTGTVAGGACSLTLTTPGERTLTASYAGDVDFNASVSTAAPHAVHQAPAFTSAASAAFRVGDEGSFEITTGGYPAAEITGIPGLPDGLTLVDNGDGTATLHGTPQAGTGGTYPITLTARNGVGGDVTQDFTLTVDEDPPLLPWKVFLMLVSKQYP